MTPEIVIRKSKSEKVFGIIFSFACVIYGIYMLYTKDWHGSVLIIGGIVVYLIIYFSYKKNRPLIKINEDKIWTSESGWLEWKSIEKIRINYIYAIPNNSKTLEIYKIGKIDPVGNVTIDNISMSLFRLKRIIKTRTTLE